MTGAESSMLADEAGLRYVEPETPGHRRVRRGRGFSYVSPEGEIVSDRIRERIEKLVIPPAWEEVWIARDPLGHIQATGVDKAGRKQYIYHPLWEEVRDEAKFDRLAPFGRGLAGLRRWIDADLRKRGLPRAKVVALAVAVLDATLVRVGNRRYAEDNESYGLTTITCDHVHVDGLHVHLAFSGKGGAEHELVFKDRRLAGLVSGCQELSGQTLFSYETPHGDVSSISSSDVNAYLSETPGGPFTAKDFRTWGASSQVLGELARNLGVEDADERLRQAIDVAADRLGNTREICRDSYVHPRVIAVNTDGTLEAGWSRRRAGKWLNRDESALRHLLDTEEGQSW
jgi:DNA topoisomerase-1